MIRDFLTVEDVNTVSYANQGFYWHEIDTSKISSDSDFDWTKYDFCEVKRETGTFGYFTHRFSFKIHHSNWANGLYILKNNGDRLTSYTKNFSNNVLTISTNEESIKVFLYFGLTSYSSTKMINAPLINNILGLNYKELNTTQTIKVWNLTTKEEKTTTADVNVGFNAITYSGNDCGFLLVNLLKTNFQFNCNQILTVGKVNKVYLCTDSDYLPNGDLVGTYTPNITVQYNGETLPVTFDGTDYYFNLDLTDRTEAENIRFVVNVESNEVLNNTITAVTLTANYPTINTYNQLVNACKENNLIMLGNDITLSAVIPVTESIKIIGDGKTLNLNGYGFELMEDVTFNAENLQLNNGDTAIKQAKNTILELTNCSFTGCTSTSYNGLGSCILHDIDYNSLSVEDDYTTALTGCTFTNNIGAILSGGELNITGCTFHNNTFTDDNTNIPSFIYQTDGECHIQKCNFNIECEAGVYTDKNMDYNQCILICGETATINGIGHTDLQSDDSLPILDNNTAVMDCTYYYPQITGLVNISGNGCCHAVSGVDWVFKNKVSIRRTE